MHDMMSMHDAALGVGGSPARILCAMEEHSSGGDDEDDGSVDEGQPPSPQRSLRMVGPAEALRALGGVLTQELASCVAERQRAADMARQHQQCRERVLVLEREIAEEQERKREAVRQSSQGLTPAERRRRARGLRASEQPPSQVAHELELAQERLVESLKSIEQRYTDGSALASRADRSERGLHAAQAQLVVQEEAVVRLEETVRRLGDEVVRLRQNARSQAASMRHTVGSHNAELQQMKEEAAGEISRLVEEVAAERQQIAGEAASGMRRVTEDATAELERATQEAASERQRLIKEHSDERQRLIEEAVSERQRLIEKAVAEKQRKSEETASEIMRIKEEAAAEIMRVKADSAAEKQQMIQRHGQLLQSARAEARADALSEATRTIESTKAEAARETRLANAAVAEAATAAAQAKAQENRSREVWAGQSSALSPAEAYSGEYEDTLETLSSALLGLRKTNAKLVAAQVDSERRAQDAEDRVSQLEEELQRWQSRREQGQAQADNARLESNALRNGRAALRSELAKVTQRLESVVQANHEAAGRLLTAEYTLLVGNDGRPRLLEQLEGAARCLLKETEVHERKLAKGIEIMYLAFAAGDPVVDKLKRDAAVAAASSATASIDPSTEVEALRSALSKVCMDGHSVAASAAAAAGGANNSGEDGAVAVADGPGDDDQQTRRKPREDGGGSSGGSTLTGLQQQLQQDCGLTQDDCSMIVDRLVKHTVTMQQANASASTSTGGSTASTAAVQQRVGESLFKCFLRLGWECLCDSHKRESIASKFGIVATEAVMVAHGQQAWAKRTAVLRGDCLLFFGEKEFEALGLAPRSNITLRTALVGQLVEIPSPSVSHSHSHPLGAATVELAFSVSTGDTAALFWIRAADQERTRGLHLSVLTAQRAIASSL